MIYDFDKQQRKLQEYLNSEENLQRVAPFEALCEESLALRRQYKDSFEALNRAAEENVVRREYAKGGGTIHRGVYNPGILDLIVGGMNRGRLLKKTPKDNHYNYEYLFDAQDRMICVKNYDEYSDYRMTGIEFLIHNGDEVLSFGFEISLNIPPVLVQFSRCKYRDGALLRYEWIYFRTWSGDGKCSCDKVSVEDFQYEAGQVTSYHWYDYLQDIKMLRQEIITFHRDEEGDLSTYTIKKVGGFKSRFDRDEENYVYEVPGAKRKKKQARKIQKTISLQTYLENKVRDVISSWDEEGIYAISFFVYANESYEYKGFTNVTEFSVSYNTEQDCEGAGERSEERWNYAFWRQNETPILQADEEDEGMKLLFDWYAKKGIENIGYEDFDACYDDNMRYIGKGPVGYYELLSEITAVAKKLQDSGFIRDKFGAPIPIIIHDLEYAWYVIEATKQANSHGEADTFLAAMKDLGFTD